MARLVTKEGAIGADNLSAGAPTRNPLPTAQMESSKD